MLKQEGGMVRAIPKGKGVFDLTLEFASPSAVYDLHHHHHPKWSNGGLLRISKRTNENDETKTTRNYRKQTENVNCRAIYCSRDSARDPMGGLKIGELTSRLRVGGRGRGQGGGGT